jgi:hypothetical protein
MKQKNLHYTLTAALLTLVTAAAYGQTNTMIADIPFAFHAVGSNLPAGRYQVAPATTSSPVMEVRNLDTGKTAYVLSKVRVTESKDSEPRLVFQCRGEDDCSLARLWSGAGIGMEFLTPALTSAHRERGASVYVIRLTQK